MDDTDVTKVILNERMWIPSTPKLKRIAQKRFQVKLYQENNCAKCEYRPERHCDVCDDCPNFIGEFKLWKSKQGKSGKKYIGFPTGKRRLLKQLMPDDASVVDQRPRPKFRFKVKFIRKMWKNQRPAVRELTKKKYGLLEAPPRSGKTPMAVKIAVNLGMKTLVLANQHEYLNEFNDTIYGNEKNKIEPFTNIPEIEARLGRKIAGFTKNPKEMAKYDIVLLTYQSLITEKGQELLEKIKNMFGTLIIDEADKVAAEHYMRVISRFNVYARIGVTGTVERKDRRDLLTRFILGPVNYEMEAETMIPRVEIIETGVSTSYRYKVWTYAIRFLANHVKRNLKIVKEAVKDIEAGRSVIIPCVRVDHAKALTSGINALLPDTKPAELFYSQIPKVNRKKIIEGARNGKVKAVVGIRSMLQRGINVPRWDTLYVVMPISNPPNFKQETARIRTPMEGKKEPMVKFFLDDFDVSKGCFRTCWWQTVIPERFKVSPGIRDMAQKYLRRPGAWGDKESSRMPRQKITF